MHPSTSKFLIARPYAVLSASPALAALYAIQGSTGSDWCNRCGSYLLDGTPEIRIVRFKSPDGQAKRVLQRTCGVCGKTSDESTTEKSASEQASLSSPQPPHPPQHSDPSPLAQKPRTKKKSTLQALLSQSRDRTTQVQPTGAKDDADSGRLAAFLSGL